MKFYIGLHHPADARYFSRAFISINAVRGRKSPILCDSWILDSGAFTEIKQHGGYRHSEKLYVDEINRLASINSGLLVAVSQDWMCEPIILDRTGLTLLDHQRLTIERYDAILPNVRIYLMPVLQGYSVQSYIDHIDQYGERIVHGMYVGVGSICKRNGAVDKIESILTAIKRKRPDLRLHGFGLKKTALASGIVRDLLHSADSMAWSFAARMAGRSPNDWREAASFAHMIDTMPVQNGFVF